MNPKDKFLSRLAVLAQLCPGFLLSKEVVAIYDQELSTLGYDRASFALESIIKTRRSRDSFPSIAEIREVIEPKVEPRCQAVDVAARILGAVRKHGLYWTSGFTSSGQRYFRGAETRLLPTWRAAAESEFGELGLMIVSRMGGWTATCEFSENSDPTVFQAQLRDLSISIQNQAKAGTLHLLPALPRSSREQTGVTSIFGVIRGLIPAHMRDSGEGDE